MTQKKLIGSFIFVVLLVGCSGKNGDYRSSHLKNYTYRFSMEIVGNYKVDFQMNPDSTFQIEQQNYFFDRQAGTNTPDSKQGVLSAEEFSRLNKLVIESDIYRLDDSYGFDESSDNSIFYTIELHQGERVKYVTINADTDHRFSDEFSELIEFTTKFMNDKLGE